MSVKYPSGAMAKLREGTEVLRTGGGICLTTQECNDLLDYIKDTETRLATTLYEGVDADERED